MSVITLNFCEVYFLKWNMIYAFNTCHYIVAMTTDQPDIIAMSVTVNTETLYD